MGKRCFVVVAVAAVFCFITCRLPVITTRGTAGEECRSFMKHVELE